jgi:hypothetical protein
MSDAGSSRSGISISSLSGSSRGGGGGGGDFDGGSAAVGSATTSPRGTPSNRDVSASWFVGSRGIKAAEAAYDFRFESKEGAAAIARGLLSSRVGCDDTDGTLLGGLVEAFDCAYAKEEDFNIDVFKAMAECFDADTSR